MDAVFKPGIVAYPLRIIDFSIVCKVLGEFLLRRGPNAISSYGNDHVNPKANVGQTDLIDTGRTSWHFGQLTKNAGILEMHGLGQNRHLAVDVSVSHPTNPVVFRGTHSL